ncbi:MAG TPA: hypothetical protein VF339_04265 [Gammaproteobacteria bacterium]
MRARLETSLVAAVVASTCHAQPYDDTQHARAVPREAAQAPCTPEQREAALEAIQARVLAAAPTRLESLSEAIEPGGPLEGWRLAHGHVVLEGAGAVPLDNLDAAPPLPPLLLYVPSPATTPDDWLDFDGDDGPYTLVGWAFFAPYGPELPRMLECIEPDEWFVHEAGWHTRDGGMRLTPDTPSEQPPPPADVDVLFWHPRVWDIHFWIEEDGPPAVSFDNPNARPGGLELPKGAFYRIDDGP